MRPATQSTAPMVSRVGFQAILPAIFRLAMAVKCMPRRRGRGYRRRRGPTGRTIGGNCEADRGEKDRYEEGAACQRRVVGDADIRLKGEERNEVWWST